MRIILWIAVFCSVLLWSGIKPHDYFTWVLEVAPALIGSATLWFTRKSFIFTPLVYGLILIHCKFL